MMLNSSYITNNLFVRNPWVTLWWSAAFPGCGHLMLCKFFTGFMLIGWEFYINVSAHVNEAIFYSMTGQFELAKSVLDTRLFLLYIGVYVFAMWDCYCLTVDLNELFLLADLNDAPIKPVAMTALELNYLDYRNPWNATWWTFFAPGLGYLKINRLPSAILIFIGFTVIVYYSRLLPALQATFYGDFARASALPNPEWLLFLPSFVGFTAHDVYIQTIALNKLFKREQSRYFADQYQTPSFRLPFGGTIE
jgi:hypothetical protein